jgi:hypothetical protein
VVVVIKVLFILVGAGLVLGGFFAPAGRLGFGGPETTLFALVGSMVDMINIDKIAVPPALVAMKIPLIVASVAAAGGAVLTMVLGLFGFLRSSLVPAVVTLAGVAFLIYRLYGGEGFLIEVPESWAWALLFAGALLAIMTAVSAMFGSYRAQKVRQRTEPAVGRAPRDRGPHFAEPALAAATASSVPPANVPPAKPAAPAKAAPPAHTIAAMGGTAGGTAGAGMGDAPLRADKPSPPENNPPPHIQSPPPQRRRRKLRRSRGLPRRRLLPTRRPRANRATARRRRSNPPRRPSPRPSVSARTRPRAAAGCCRASMPTAWRSASTSPRSICAIIRAA